ncbi:MAG: MarR family transcriptional regulator [Streptosporangiales bacterium]|nr:MarR family transcriptional regulator [Streptosporangiales bacterium]
MKPATDLEHGLPLALMRIGRQLKAVTARTPDEAWAVLLLHKVRENGHCRVSELAAQAGLDTSTVSRHVARLEKNGHLERTEDPADRRASQLALTPRGRRMLKAATQARIDLIHQAVADWSEDELRTLCALTDRLAAALEEHVPGTES